MKLNAPPQKKNLMRLLKGVSLDGHPVYAQHIAAWHPRTGTYPIRSKRTNSTERAKATNSPWLQMVIMEGRNRQVHRMFECIGLRVLKLKRVAIGRFKVGNLKPGEWRPLRPYERDSLTKTLVLQARFALSFLQRLRYAVNIARMVQRIAANPAAKEA